MPPPSSPYADLDRPPLRQAELDRALAPPWTAIALLDEVDSTNAAAADRARGGDRGGLVVIAESQSAGRGRLGRTWVAPPRAGLTLSLLLRPQAPPAQWPWLVALVAVGTARALSERAEIDVRLKWPNDLVVGDRKIGGLLAEVVDDAVVVGLGVNVTTRRAELPRPDATSVSLETGRPADRLPLLLSVLRAVGSGYREWETAAGDPATLAAAYRGLCTTLGRRVRAELPDGTALVGEAVDVDANGHLVMDVNGVHTAVAAADVVHLRPA